MKKIFWEALVLSGVIVFGTLVIAQERATQPAMPEPQGMGSMMGTGVMGQGGQMGQTGSMMPMMQGMAQMMEACSQMMGTATSTDQRSDK